jgi:replicative DNA helicase
MRSQAEWDMPRSAQAHLKTMPHATEAEQSVLGGLLLDNQAWFQIADLVVESDFYHRNHTLIFRAIAALSAQNIPFDVITVSDWLEKQNLLSTAGGFEYLVNVARNTPSAANITTYAEIVRECSVLRQLNRVGTEITESTFDAQNRSPSELLEEAEKKIFAIAEQTNRKGGFLPIRQILTKAIDKIDELFQKNTSITGISSGYSDLDDKTAGLQPSDLIIIAGRPSMGKCFGKGTPILMYSGEIKPVEKIQVGDLLMGDDSTPRKVLSLARGQEKMYWIRQNKGMDYRVNESHILSLKRSRNEGKHKNGDILNISLMDYLNSSTKFRSNYKGYKVAVEFEEHSLPISPYFLGLWLGDGTNSSVSIATTDQEIIDYLKEYANELGLYLTENIATDKEGHQKCPMYSITSQQQGGSQDRFSLQGILRELGVLNNKHIPHLFLVNSRQHRLQLLAGLIDSNGYYASECKTYEITQKNYNLAKQIKFLCDSLGFKTSLIEKQARIKKIDYKCTVYQVRFSGNIDEIPVKIPGKKADAWTSYRTWQQTGIQIEYDKIDDYYGFVCDGNRLFLLEDMTVVHNTSFAMNIAENVAVGSHLAVAVFSLEMPGEQLVMRLIASLGRIDQQKVRTGRLDDDDWPRLTMTVNMLAETKLFIDDTPGLTPSEIRARARRLVREEGQLGLIVIDYLQLMQMSGNKENRATAISEISRSLKSLAKELNVPVIALSQLNRSVEHRTDKRPQLADLRESGAIEQDADLVMFIYRDEVYNEESPDKGTAEIIIAKQRNGPIGMVRLAFHGQFTRFENFASERYYSEE